MAYRIDYRWDKEKQFLKNTSLGIWKIAGVIALTIAMGIRLFTPYGTILEEVFSPLGNKIVADAFQALLLQLEQGVSFGDAMAVFCVEVLVNGG